MPPSVHQSNPTGTAYCGVLKFQLVILQNLIQVVFQSDNLMLHPTSFRPIPCKVAPFSGITPQLEQITLTRAHRATRANRHSRGVVKEEESGLDRDCEEQKHKDHTAEESHDHALPLLDDDALTVLVAHVAEHLGGL